MGDEVFDLGLPEFGFGWVGVEGVEHRERVAAFDAEDFPIDVVTRLVLLEPLHERGAGARAGVRGREKHRVVDVAVGEAPRIGSLFEREAEVVHEIDLVKFEILRLDRKSTRLNSSH